MELLYRYKRAFLLVGMGICVFAMVVTLNPNYRPGVLVGSLGRIVVPLQGAATSATSWVGNNLTLLWEMSRLQQENERLLEQIGWLEIENQRLQLAGEENRSLLELLYIRERYGELPTVGARVIAHDPSGWYSSFTIDRGANDGLAQNMAVLGAGGLVGKIAEARPTSSRVIAILDDHFGAAVQTVRTEDQGTVRGDSTLMQQGLVRMEHISYAAHIMAGDELITSVISNIFPPGIRVGTVVDVQPTPDGLAQYAIVNPAANVRRLEHVLVVNQLFTADSPYSIGEGDYQMD